MKTKVTAKQVIAQEVDFINYPPDLEIKDFYEFIIKAGGNIDINNVPDPSQYLLIDLYDFVLNAGGTITFLPDVPAIAIVPGGMTEEEATAIVKNLLQ